MGSRVLVQNAEKRVHVCSFGLLVNGLSVLREKHVNHCNDAGVSYLTFLLSE